MSDLRDEPARRFVYFPEDLPLDEELTFDEEGTRSWSFAANGDIVPAAQARARAAGIRPADAAITETDVEDALSEWDDALPDYQGLLDAAVIEE